MSTMTCKKCDTPMVVKKSDAGAFLACPNFPDCKHTESLKSLKTNDLRHFVKKLSSNLDSIRIFADGFQHKTMVRCVDNAHHNLENIIMELIEILARK